MPTCFVIQPFDGGPFDKRYEDVFLPAIENAGLEAYRVDRDPSATVPIEDVEKGIRKADACLADISLPNPNVWFEVGFAIASRKPVVLVCSHEPGRRFPFDIQHRAVINYRTESARDFDDLKKQISVRLSAAIAKEERLEQLAEATVVADLEGLTQHEIATLATVAENDPSEFVSNWSIRNDMERAGYTKIATALALANLVRKKMLESKRDADYNGNEFTAYAVSEQGMNWLIANQDRLVLTRQRTSSDDDIPF